MAVAFAPDGKHAASSADGQFIYWDLATKKGLNVPLGHPGLVCLAFTPDGRRIYFCSEVRFSGGGYEDRGVVGYWDTDGLGPPTILDREHGHLGLAILPDGGLATTDLGGIARIWRPSRTIDRARKLEAAGRRYEAAADYARAIADRPDDARLLIERGRLLFEMGRTSEAEADYARAARLVPDNPQLVLDTAGWWIAGPYPPDLEVPASFQGNNVIDPSKAAPTAGNQPQRWRRAAVGMQGLVDLRKVYEADEVAAYALTIFDCATDREIVLTCGVDDRMVYFFNGEHIQRDMSVAESYPGGIYLCQAKAGRNTILAKVLNEKQGHSFNMVISQSPADATRVMMLLGRWNDSIASYKQALARDPSTLDPRVHWNGGIALAQAGRWKEAAEAFRGSVERKRGEPIDLEAFGAAHLAANDVAAVRRIAADLVGKHAATRDINQARFVGRIVAMVPDAFKDYTTALRLTQRFADGRQADADAFSNYGAVLYRARRYEGSLHYLDRATQHRGKKGSPFDWVFLAMARHHAKRPSAHQALATARELAKDSTLAWPQRAELEHLIKEAEFALKVPVP